MDPTFVEPLRSLKNFFDAVHRKIQNLDETLLCLSIDHVLCLFKGLKLFHDFENQPYDAINITSSDQSKFYYDLRCLLEYTKSIKHLKLVLGECEVLNPKTRIDVGKFINLRTLEIKSIPHATFWGLNVLCERLESLVVHRCGVSSIKAILHDSNGTTSKRSIDKNEHPSWRDLKILKLKNNRINVIDETINMAKNIEVLDLSYNCIKSSNSSLESLEKLESLLLDYNSITSLTNFISPSMTKLVQLSISYNLLQSLEGIEHLMNLRELDVSYNLIMTADNIMQLKSLKSLEKFYIAGNPLCLDKNYKSSVILKLHPAVIDQIVLDGRKLSRGDKKMFMSKFDSPENPIPVIGQDAPSQSIRSNRKKPTIISEIPDQTNFQDDEDFLVSDSFHERIDASIHQQGIADHFQATHEHFRPSFEHRPDLEKVALQKVAEERRDGEKSVDRKVEDAEHQTFKPQCLIDLDEQKEASMDSMTAVQIKVQAVIESPCSGYQKEGGIKEDDSTGSMYEDPNNTFDKFDASVHDSSIYFDAEQSPSHPSIDRSVHLHKRLSRVATKIPLPSDAWPAAASHDQNKETDSLKSGKDDAPKPLAAMDQGMQKGSLGLGRSLFFGMRAEDQDLLQKDLSDGERSFPVTMPTTPSLKLVCVVRHHWLLVAYGKDLPRLNIRENFDLKALKKISRIKGQEKALGLEFDTMQKQKRERVFVVDGDAALYEEFLGLLKQFVVILDQKMLECLKCGHVFEDRPSSSSSSGVTHSSELQLKAKKALAKQKEKDKQSCPRCSSGMIVETTRKQQDGGKSSAGWLDVIAKQLYRKDFAPIEDMLNKSLSSEMGFVEEASTSELTSSGTYRRTAANRKFIDRGIIGADDDVKYYVDEEGQEAV